MAPGPSEFFTRHVEANTDAVAWAVKEVEPERLHATPPELLGEWPAARHLFHLVYYEREVALPSIRMWFGAPYPNFTGYNEPVAWAEAPHEELVLTEFQGLRSAQLALISGPDKTLWDEVRQTPWGHRTLYWVVSKTLQHAFEHTNNILKIALLWAHYEVRSRRRGSQVAGGESNEIE